MKAAVPIPHRMRHLPRDRRGYPVPVIVAKKAGEEPAFSVNDIEEQARVVDEDRCSICDGRLLRGRWLVGGCLSAIACDGSFYDEATHEECLHYALQVCPYLALPKWNGSVAMKQVERMGGMLTFDVAKTDPDKPQAFVAVMSVGIEVKPLDTPVRGMNLYRPKPGTVRKVEVWRDGRQLTADEMPAFREHVAAQLARFNQQPRMEVWRMIGGR